MLAAPIRLRSLLARLMPAGARAAQDDSGATAVEFGIVAMPFFMMLFGIIAVGFYYFIMFTLENAVEDAARLIRTGQVQTANMTAASFKTQVCSHLPTFVDCTNKLRINVQNFTTFGSVSTPSCTDSGGALIADTASVYNVGASSSVVLVSACYQWDLAGAMPFIQLGTMAGGAALIQAATVFMTEPY